jgi:hypothetical protein
MRKIRPVIFGILLILSCKQRESAPATETAATQASDTAVTTTATTATTQTTAAATVTTATTAPAFRLDHFKIWKVQAHQMKPIVVQLKGQFDKSPWKAEVRSLEYLGNPVDKNKEGIHDKYLHYVAYAIRAEQQPARAIQVQNQFTGEKWEEWRLAQPAWLLVPADKKLQGKPENPPKGDHFVCYAADNGNLLQKPVTLSDQFDQGKIEEIKELKARFFCVPVTKQREGHQPEPIINADTHLAVYAIQPPRAYPKPVWTNDQFGVQELKVIRSEFLAVPSLKKWVRLQPK